MDTTHDSHGSPVAGMPMTPASAEISVSGILGQHVEGTRTALVWGSHQRTYDELRRRARSLAGALVRAGLQPGDRVAAHLKNRGETFELYFACALAGLTFVPVNFRLTARELRLVLEDSGARVLFTQDSIAEPARAAAGDIPLVELEDLAPGPDYSRMAEGEPLRGEAPRTDTHLLLFTSGTTGRPKAVRLTHMNILWFAWQQVAHYGIGRDSVMLLVAPTFNTAGINEFSIPTLLVGGTVVIQPSGGWRPEVLTELVDDWRVTHTCIFPSQLKPVLDADAAQPQGFRTLQFVATGGESCPPELLLRFRRRWPHVRLLQGYGQSETGLVTVCAGEDLDEHPDSIGRVVAGTSCRIVGPDGREAPVGEPGELFVAGPSVSPGYWNAEELTAAAFVDGWFATGDLGRRDEQGFLRLSGRRKEVIISKGQNIYPAEIEHALLRHEQVTAVAVVGVPDDEFGEAVAAAVVRGPGSALSSEDVVAFARQELASYKKPRHVVFVEELPRTAAGKVDKQQLTAAVTTQLRS